VEYESGMSALAAPPGVGRQTYDRAAVTAGIAHLGVGNFHRAHQAWYVDRLLAEPGAETWGILGIGIVDSPAEREKAAALRAQAGTYTLTVCPPEAPAHAAVIGAIVEYCYLADDPEAVFTRLADPAIRIVSLTITEGGYNLDDRRRFVVEAPGIAADLAGGSPRTVFGVVVEALRRRRASGAGPFTILSCDNLMHNGGAARAAFVGYARALDPDLADWIEAAVAFPDSMVDGIAPQVSAEDVRRLDAQSGVADRSPVFREDFTQWVIEDRFCAGRPPLERVGVQFTADVAPYELVKLRMLNAGHSVMALPSVLLGHALVHEAMADPLVRALVEQFLTEDAAPHVIAPPGVTVDAYASQLLRRFSNPAIRDQVLRIAGQSSAKLPVFLAPTLRAILDADGDARRIAFVLAAFLEYVRGRSDAGATYEVSEPALAATDRELAAANDPRAFARMSTFAGWGLERSTAFVDEVVRLRVAIARDGTAAVLGPLLG